MATMTTRRFLAVVLAMVSALPSGLACAFPNGACVPSVCNSLDAAAFSPLLDDTYFYANSTGFETDFSQVPSTLGYYFSKYNPYYNRGVFDQSKTANRDGAPSVNYFELRTTLGEYNSGGVTLASCCNRCRQKVGCSLWAFNPYVSSSDDPTLPDTFSGTGDCYFLLQSQNGQNWTYDMVNSYCQKTVYEGLNSTDDTVKSIFYSGKCNSQIKDDPHFVGARGTRFDFNGELDKSFCLLTDEKLHINALLRGYVAPGAGEKGMRSWMKEIGITWLGQAGRRHSIRLAARTGGQQERGPGYLAAVELDGEALEVPDHEGVTLRRGDFSLTFEGVGKAGKFDVDNFQLKVGDLLDLHLALRPAHPKLQTPQDAEVHFNLAFDGLKVTQKVHGVLGQTYRETPGQETKAAKYSLLSQILGAPVQADGKSGAGFLEGEAKDYETSSLTSTDCKFASIAA